MIDSTSRECESASYNPADLGTIFHCETMQDMYLNSSTHFSCVNTAA